jgi:hypothetical protein
VKNENNAMLTRMFNGFAAHLTMNYCMPIHPHVQTLHLGFATESGSHKKKVAISPAYGQATQ